MKKIIIIVSAILFLIFAIMFFTRDRQEDIIYTDNVKNIVTSNLKGEKNEYSENN